MLPAIFRLQDKKDFQRVYRQGKALNTPVLRIHTLPNTLQVSRFGVVIPNKVIRRAIKRTRKKRQIRAVLQELIPALRAGHDVIIVGKTGIADADFSQIDKEIRDGFEKIHFI